MATVVQLRLRSNRAAVEKKTVHNCLRKEVKTNSVLVKIRIIKTYESLITSTSIPLPLSLLLPFSSKYILNFLLEITGANQT